MYYAEQIKIEVIIMYDSDYRCFYDKLISYITKNNI